MTSPPPGEDHLDALNEQERAALAAWAHDGDAPDDFADRVVAAFVAERLGQVREAAAGEAGAGEPGVGEVLALGARTVGEGRVLRLVGLAAAVAAAAAVMLMVRVLPRASEGEPTREVAAAGRAEPAERAVPLMPAEPEPGGLEPEPGGLEPETACETDDELAAQATLIAARYCVPCHDSADRDAHPGASRVFDVQDQEWWSLMSDAQIEGARRRVQMLDMVDATEEERRTLDTFLARRLERPPHAG